MIAKKRAFELACLLGARVHLREIKDAFLDPARILSVLHLDEARIAITTAWLAAKTRRVGTNLLELTTCGAIPPSDPAWCSHPTWDDQLEHPGTTAAGDWLDGKEPVFALGELDASRFACLKRLF